MEMIMKSARLEKQTLGEKDLALINAQTLREFTADEVYTFRLMACDNRVDRDNERFTDQTLEQLAALYVGRPVLRDHSWSAGMQTARCYAASVEPDGDAKCLVLDEIESVRPGQLTRLQEGIRASLRRFFRRVLERDPVVVPIVSEV